MFVISVIHGIRYEDVLTYYAMLVPLFHVCACGRSMFHIHLEIKVWYRHGDCMLYILF